MIDFTKIGLGYENIVLKHNKCIVSSRAECDTSTEIAGKKIAVPCFPSNMKAIINEDICKQFDDAGWFHVFQRVDEDRIFPYIKRANDENWNFVSISIGIKPIYYEILKKVKEMGLRLDSVELDLALAFSNEVVPMIEFIRKNFGDINLIVGNGDSPEFIKFLADNDVTAAKVNIGVSRACRSREYVGFGSTTITDLEKCYEASLKYLRPDFVPVKIISDGGITVNGSDIHIGCIAKAIRFGASYIQSGALFSRCIDSLSIREGYFGNASEKAKQHRNNIEGASLTVETNGLTIKEMMKLIEDSIRSSISYSGGKKLADIRHVDYQIVL